MRNRIIFLFLFLISFNTTSTVLADGAHLLPEPQRYSSLKSDFTLGKVRLSTPALKQEWENFILERGGVTTDNASSIIEVSFVPALYGVPVNQDEAYQLKVSAHKIQVEAVSERGVYWAMQTLAQLQNVKGKKTVFAGCEILDWPAFRVRGFMHDVGRSYI